jgi:prefoldin subunit 5
MYEPRELFCCGAAMDELAEIEEKIDECKRFLDVLHAQLLHEVSREKDIQEEINAYSDLGFRLQEASSDKLLEPLAELCDLGHQKVFCRATIPDVSFVFVHVGMGFHIELSRSEAIAFAANRVALLRGDFLRRRSIQTDKVRQHIRASEMIMDGLAAELQLVN